MSMTSSYQVSQAASDPKVEQWVAFNEKLQRGAKKIPVPFQAVADLVEKYLPQSHSTRPVLDIGCETGKNAACLIKAGHKVTILDIAPNAIQYTRENLEEMQLGDGIVDSITGKIEELDPKHGPFKAVVGTYAFSFIPPTLFAEVMKNSVLGRVESEGYFVGGFFGAQHSWAKNPDLSIVTKEQLHELFITLGFSICEMNEKIETIQTVSNGQQLFHTIGVIAKRIL